MLKMERLFLLRLMEGMFELPDLYSLVILFLILDSGLCATLTLHGPRDWHLLLF